MDRSLYSFCLLVYFFAAATSALAQSESAKQDTNGITIIQDTRVQKLVDIYINTQPQGVPGFRVQVYFTAKKAIALEVKASFTEKFPDYDAMVMMDNPYFKVLTGAFRTKLQAEKLLKLVKVEFPGSFVVASNIPIEQLGKKN